MTRQGDAAGAIYPSLGQGANLAIEDACAAATALRAFARAAVRAGAPRVDVPAATRAIEALRLPRRCAVQAMSRDHSQHVAQLVENICRLPFLRTPPHLRPWTI